MSPENRLCYYKPCFRSGGNTTNQDMISHGVSLLPAVADDRWDHLGLPGFDLIWSCPVISAWYEMMVAVAQFRGHTLPVISKFQASTRARRWWHWNFLQQFWCRNIKRFFPVSSILRNQNETLWCWNIQTSTNFILFLILDSGQLHEWCLLTRLLREKPYQLHPTIRK